MKNLFWRVGSLGFLVGSGLWGCSGNPLPPEDEPIVEASNEPDPTATNKPPKTNNSSAASHDPAPDSSAEPEGDSGVPSTSNSSEDPAPSASEEPELPPHEPDIDPDYPGLDVGWAPDADVPGCTDSYDPDTSTLALKLSAGIYAVRLSAHDDTLFANGRPCTQADGSALSLEDLERIYVEGGDEDNVVILDMSEGDFGDRLYQNAGAFYFELGEGDDQFLLRGSSDDDAYYGGSGTRRLMLALTSTARINVWGRDIESVDVSTGPGDDSVEYIGRLNVGLFDVDTGGMINASEWTVPTRIWGGAGDDSLTGGSVDDWLVGGPGNDTVSGQAGNDIFDEENESNGSDVLNGGPGLDEVSYRLRGEPLKIELCVSVQSLGCEGSDCDCTADNGEADEGDTIVNLEQVRSGTGNDRLIGSMGDDYLYGERGDDELSGSGGSDLLQGGEGTDIFDGGDNGDICDADPDEMVLSCEI